MFFSALKRGLTFRKPEVSDHKSEKTMVEAAIKAYAAELASAFCYNNPISRAAFRNEGLMGDLVALISSPHMGAGMQACGAIYSCCVNDPEMQVEIGLKKDGCTRH